MGKLDLFPMREQTDAFLEFFIQQGQCDAVVLSIRRTVSRIIALSSTNQWDTYRDIKDWYSGKGLTSKYLNKIHRIVDQMEYWQLNGTLAGWDDHGVDNARKHRYITVSIEKMAVEPSLGDLDLSYAQNHKDEFMECMRDRGYSESSLEMALINLKRVIRLSRSIHLYRRNWNCGYGVSANSIFRSDRIILMNCLDT